MVGCLLACGKPGSNPQYCEKQTKNFCASKDSTKSIKKTIYRMGKIFSNHISNKDLISRIYKELLKLNNKYRQTTQLKNRQN